MRTSGWTDSVSVLDRITAVLEAFGEHDDGLGVSELARRANLPKSTVSRIAADLVGQRFLDRDGDRLYIGVRLFELGQTVEMPRRLRRAALPVMNELRDRTGQTVNLAVLEAADVIIVATVRGEPTSKPPTRVGGRLPAHATALGKALLAFSPHAVVAGVVGAGLGPLTPRTICDPAVLQQELADIRRAGVAVEREECMPGRLCVASTAVGAVSSPLVAISITGLIADVAPERVAPAVRAAGIALGRAIAADHVS
ncbi:DNA-binding IclR family transcriptional regulator [Microbacterium terrae]|uniref:Acetate operon repressor n=1 Tax=Microbacterium terrae TaxID=69369 RepID=A0A0M2H483_9MICO|nr:IclR family transcriptional regulator [Microbacterium terrae]KJL38666.1 Acetate operon repressor [Microbacterium terrae]MBP1076085.1 DNA-binding IclR family transcriptional regulator [Microbacterium terrae]GLJ96905.1 IclR family transcriptional regulator [Microbacterium terrae]